MIDIYVIIVYCKFTPSYALRVPHNSLLLGEASMTSVLVLTNSFDDGHVEAVFEIIRSQGHETLRIDIDRIVKGESHISLDYSTGQILFSSPDGRFDLNEVESIWYRKPFGFSQTLGFLEHIQDHVQRMVIDKEMHDTVDSISMLLADKFWINHPTAIASARLKPYQIAVAQRCGLPVPRTLITSDPVAARKFCSEGPAVFKPITVSDMTYDDDHYAVETTLMTEELIESLDLISSQPIILQQYVEKSSELRVTCIGDKQLVARQVPHDSLASTVDWRSLQENGSHYEIDYVLPKALVEAIHRIMCEFDLGFAAMDFVVDSQGNIHFLEVNPNGQWLGYTDEIGLPAAAIFANCLVQKTRQPLERR